MKYFDTVVYREVEDADGVLREIEINVEVCYTKGSDAVMYDKYGDPGWPSEPGECEAVATYNGEEIELTEEEFEKICLEVEERDY